MCGYDPTTGCLVIHLDPSVGPQYLVETLEADVATAKAALAATEQDKLPDDAEEYAHLVQTQQWRTTALTQLFESLSLAVTDYEEYMEAHRDEE